MPMSADGCLLDQTPLSTQSIDIAHHAPPLYGEHILDQLYADMDQSGLMTPAPQSGMNTPFYNRSASGSGSHENLASLGEEPHPNGAVPPAALSSRLQNLNTNSRNNSSRRLYGPGSGSNTPHPPHFEGEVPGYFDNANHSSGVNSTLLSRRVSEEEHHVSNVATGYHTPEHVDYSDLGDLSKVPSYSTAIKSPIRGTSYNDMLPNYNTATSAPPSPVRSFSALTTPGAESRQATGGRSSNHISNLGFTPIQPASPGHVGDIDEARRLHLLRSR